MRDEHSVKVDTGARHFWDYVGVAVWKEVSMARQKRVSPVQPLLLSVADVAVQLGVCRQTVYNFIYHEKLPSIVVGRMRRIHPDSLHVWLKEREHQIA